MGLRINTNVPALNTGRVLRGSTKSLSESLERLSSGLRINRAADDAAGLAIAESFRTQVRGQNVAQRNVQDGISLVQTAEGALSETANMLQRIRELAVQSANGTQSDDNRAGMYREVIQLIGQSFEIALNTEFNGRQILWLDQIVELQTGANPEQRMDMELQCGCPICLGFSGVFITDMDSAVSAISTVDIAIENLNTRRANLGSYQNRLEFTISTLASQEENAAASESAIRDADIARESIGFTRNQILVSAGTSLLAQANVAPQSALQLIG